MLWSMMLLDELFKATGIVAFCRSIPVSFSRPIKMLFSPQGVFCCCGRMQLSFKEVDVHRSCSCNIVMGCGQFMLKCCCCCIKCASFMVEVTVCGSSTCVSTGGMAEDAVLLAADVVSTVALAKVVSLSSCINSCQFCSRRSCNQCIEIKICN